MQYPNPNPEEDITRSAPPASPSPTAASDELKQPQSSKFRGLTRWIDRLNIGPKIGYGYAIALGVATVGTATGITIGDHYQQQAAELATHAQEETYLLHRLQASVLQARTHQQQFIPLLQTPPLLQEEYEHFLVHADETQKAWSEVKQFVSQEDHQALYSNHEIHTKILPAFLQENEGVPEAYFQQAELLLEDITSRTLTPAEIEATQERLLLFTNSVTALEFDGVSDELTDIIQDSNAEHIAAQVGLQTAGNVRIQIIAFSSLLSVAIAALLAIKTSRAIARPIREVTDVAKQVTQQSNFELQAPVASQDEVGVLADAFNQLIHRVKHLLEEQKAEAVRQQQMQESQLIQSEKMSSLGRMIAGVAHEINNPVNFIYGNLTHANGYIEDLLSLIQTYQTEVPHPPQAVQDQIEDIDIEFVAEDLPKLLQSMQVGADRVRQIVLSLKNFSRLDDAVVHSVDLHACLDSTLLILNNRLKKGVQVVRNYGNLPIIEGYSGLLYQVFMNILSNAVDALEEQTENTQKQITITTELAKAGWVTIRITDNGPGIATENQDKIFDTFFTTKPSGIGTGLGLSISRQIIQEKHHGLVSCHPNSGGGTEFLISLPIQHPSSKAPLPNQAIAAGTVS